MKELFDKVSLKASKVTTHMYSTSFSLGIRLLDKRLRDPIYAIYGFVRLGDEIVDTFHDYNKERLFEEFMMDLDNALSRKISLNPILNSFQNVVHKYNIDRELIDQFMESMRMDLNRNQYDREMYNRYILGSAEVVGLMCLRVFTGGNEEDYIKMKPYAMALGSAFQKVNFLRDIRNDYQNLGRTYFPEIDFNALNPESKQSIEVDIENDFAKARRGISMLPVSARLGVYVAYVYYFRLFRKIKNESFQRIMNERVRISNVNKMSLLFFSYLRYKLVDV